eukprot:TRINITY_DN2991_c0_g2_i1.p1 TRINITY_DN2991_c0_g2~~TRINITY_DN2991_c0_g2_i1.p1  ORF type:complete len:350 (-),score=69.13 TRINITY_DN2991_c0_g2_i1:233-1282(-)
MASKLSCYVGLFLIVIVAFSAIATADECPDAPSTPGDRRPNKNQLVVAAYNTEWLFWDRSNCPGSGCPWPNQAAAELHFKAIALEIETLNADIVSLEEVQDCSALQRLLSYMNPNTGYVPYLISGTDTATGQNVGLLTRVDPSMDLKRTDYRYDYPVYGSKCYGSSLKQVEADTTGLSKHYYTVINVNDVRILFVGIHLVAFPTMDVRCSQREAQASVVQYIVKSMEGEYDELIILGDCNDYSATAVDAAGDIPTSRVLEFLSMPTYSEDYVMTNVASVLPQNLRYSCWWDADDSCYDEGGKENTMIDHLLVSPGLEKYMVSATIAHTYNATCKSYYSDHWPVVATFSF